MATGQGVERGALDEVMEGLNPAQREAVEHLDGPLLIFAGAGSGKTRVLTARVANLIAQRKVWPDRLLAVTFTNKAAREMRERVQHLVGTEDRMWVQTFHSTCVRMLRRDAESLGFPRSFTIFDDDDSRSAIRRVLEELHLDPKKYKPSQVLVQISKAKSELVAPQNYPDRSYQDEIIRRCYERYEDILRRSGGLDFDDLIGKTVELLQTDEEARDRWRDRFRYVLVDEYQDTNHAQYVLCNVLCGEHRQLAVVGDDDQSIYRFRGADVRNILDFGKDYPEAKTIRLEQNYRSTQPILDAAYQIIRKNPERAEKRLWTDRAGGDKIAMVQLYNEIEEAEFVADEIERLRRVDGRQYADCAVLYRTNAQSRAFEDVFRRRMVTYRLVGGVRFWERAEVKDLLAYLRLVANPNDSVSLSRVVNVPRRKIGRVSVDALISHAEQSGRSLLETMASPQEVPSLPRSAVAPVERFHAQLQAVRSMIGALPPSQLVEQLIAIMGLTDHYRDGTPQGEARLENLAEVEGLAQEYDDRGEPGEALGQLLTEVALVSDVDSYNQNGDGVTLITLHMVKGLEFPVVFLVGMEDGLLPHSRALEDESELPEERRLCYVGITRARDRLYMSCAFRRHLYGRSEAAFPSQFLSDIPRTLVAEGGRGAAPVSPPRRGERGQQGGGAYRARLIERQIESKPAEPPVQRYGEGDIVEHTRFGIGRVLKSTLTQSDEELVVEFQQSGLKILSASLAPLRKR
ncbi:MAG TPA: UvrD-helicase domain-containing protein [Candidatus Dormibacteraeota bacterium]|nr:UvrD-helicase domain-containing protein [Candidatus Dormibacteraeota bacterium]